ncbi:MAG: hypothetical protein ACREJ2_10890, partial [Planctomycetota bacterium]
LSTRLPGVTNGQIFPEAVFQAAYDESVYRGVMDAGGLTLGSVGKAHQYWRPLTMNLVSDQNEFGLPSQIPFAEKYTCWIAALFVAIFIWLSFNVYEMVLGSLRFAGLLLAVGLGTGSAALFYQAGAAYPGALPFYAAVGLAFLGGHFRFRRANRLVGEPYFWPLDGIVVAIELFLCFYLDSNYSFIVWPSVFAGAVSGVAFLYTVPASARQKAAGVPSHRYLRYACGALAVALLGGLLYSDSDAAACVAQPALRVARLGLKPEDRVMESYDAKGAMQVVLAGGGATPTPTVASNGDGDGAGAGAGGGTGQGGGTTHPPPDSNPKPAGNPPTNPATNPAVGANPQPAAQPSDQVLPPLVKIDPAERQAVFDFDSQTALPFFQAKADAVMQMKVAGWPSEMKTVIEELHLAKNLKDGFAPVAAYRTKIPALQALVEEMTAEYQAYADWLTLIEKAPDNNLLTRTAIQSALQKALNASDRRRQHYATVALRYKIQQPTAELLVPVPTFKHTTVGDRAQEFHNLFEKQISPAEGIIGDWLDQLQQDAQQPVEMKKLVQSKDMIKQLQELSAAIAKVPVSDAKNREYQQAYLDELKGLIGYLQYILDHSPDNERLTWRAIENDYDAWLAIQAKRKQLETNLVDRFNFKYD